MSNHKEIEQLSAIEQQAEIWYEQVETQKQMLADYEDLIQEYDAELKYIEGYLLSLDREITNIYRAGASISFDLLEELADALWEIVQIDSPPRIT